MAASKKIEAVLCDSAAGRVLWKKLAVLITIFATGALLYFCLSEVELAQCGIAFVKSKCSINESRIEGNMFCSCGVYTPTACYPCLKVFVSLVVHEEVNLGPEPIMLHESLYTLEHKCSFKPLSCCHDDGTNAKVVKEKKEEIEKLGDSFPCYHNPNNMSQVILHRHNYELIIVSSIVWPMCGIVIGIWVVKYIEVLELRTELERRKHFDLEAKKSLSIGIFIPEFERKSQGEYNENVQVTLV